MPHDDHGFRCESCGAQNRFGSFAYSERRCGGCSNPIPRGKEYDGCEALFGAVIAAVLVAELVVLGQMGYRWVTAPPTSMHPAWSKCVRACVPQGNDYRFCAANCGQLYPPVPIPEDER